MMWECKAILVPTECMLCACLRINIHILPHLYTDSFTSLILTPTATPSLISPAEYVGCHVHISSSRSLHSLAKHNLSVKSLTIPSTGACRNLRYPDNFLTRSLALSVVQSYAITAASIFEKCFGNLSIHFTSSS